LIHTEIGYPIEGLSVGKLVCFYANKALSNYNLEEFDYILKSDEDVIYPHDFLEVNTAQGYDLMGGAEAIY